MKLQCAICENSYSSRFVCAKCKVDPANVDWREGNESLSNFSDVENTLSTEGEEVPWNEGPSWQPSPLFSQIARLLQEGRLSRSEIAMEAKCSLRQVYRVANAVGFGPRVIPKIGRHIREIWGRNVAREWEEAVRTLVGT